MGALAFENQQASQPFMADVGDASDLGQRNENATVRLYDEES